MYDKGKENARKKYRCLYLDYNGYNSYNGLSECQCYGPLYIYIYFPPFIIFFLI